MPKGSSRSSSRSSRSTSSRSVKSRAPSKVTRSVKATPKAKASAPKKVTVSKVKNITNLVRHASKKGAVRVGATVKPSARASQYKAAGYKGTMHVTKTSNMRAAENKLLKTHAGRHNVQKTSNAAAEPGFVYSIKGCKKST